MWCRDVIVAFYFIFSIPITVIGQANPDFIPTGNRPLPACFSNPTMYQEDDGFLLNSTEAITQDHLGFMWIGGRGGLLRFDGYSFQKFPLCVAGDEVERVRDLWFDRERKRLWIATWGHGVLQIDLQTYTCSDINTGSGRHKKHTYWLYPDEQILWIGKSQGITALSLTNGSVQEYRYKPLSLGDSISVGRSNNFLSYHRDRFEKSILWLGSVSGLLRFDLKTGSFSRYYYSGSNDRNVASNSIRTIHQLQDGSLIAGTWGGGLISFQPDSQTFSPLYYNDEDSGFNIIDDIVPIAEKRVWVTSKSGVLELDIQTGEVLNEISNVPGDQMYYGCQYIDSTGRLYFGKGNTFTVYDPVLQQFTSHDLPANASKNPSIEVKALLKKSGTDNLSLITYGSKYLFTLNEKSDQWSVTDMESELENQVFYPIGIHHTPKQYRVIADRSNTYVFFAPDEGFYKRHTLWPGKDLHITYALEHSDGSYWFSTIREGLIRKEADKVTQYKSELNSPVYEGHYATLGKMREDHLGNVWISSITGYSVYDYQRDTFFNVPYMLGDTTTLVDISDIVRDSSNNIWMITVRHGLMLVDPERPEAGVVSIFKGVQGKNITAASVDANGHIWLLTELGLEKFDPNQLESRLIRRSYGLNPRVKDISQLPDGRMYLVYPLGFQLFHPDSLRTNQSLPIPYLSTFSVFDEPLQTEKPLHRLQAISLSPKQNFFSIGFSGIHFSMSHQDTFAYKLEGVDPEWVQTTDRRRVFYTNIPSGRYTFRLKAGNNEGVWTEQPIELSIIIATPWWKTPWAIASFVSLLGFLIYALYRFQLSRSLAIAESERLRDMHAWQSEVYANITHEFRTPITVILGMTEYLKTTFKAQHKNDKVRPAEVIRRNSLRLLRLVNDMLDLAKLEHGSLSLRPKRTEIVGFIKYECESFHALAHEKDIRFTIQSQEDFLEIDIDREKWSTILSNLISNAFKYTPVGGEVCVDLARVQKDQQTYVQLRVSDTGKGLPVSEQTAIFQRFYQSDPTDKKPVGSSGLGLALTRELVVLMGGTIDVQSEPGLGSTFRVLLPVPETATHSSFAEAASLPQSRPVRTDAPDRNTVLIVEDNADVAAYLRWCLAEKYDIIQATNGRKGQTLALEHIPDIIISDVMMPEMDGFTLCEKLKTEERTNHIPIVLLTAKATPKDKVYGIKRGADAYLVKPFDQAELVARLNQLLKTRATLQQKYTARLHHPQVPIQPEDPFLKKAEEEVLYHMDDPSFSNTDLARGLHLSESQIYRKIKALTGMSTSIFIRQLRLYKAKELLLEEDLTISQIAFKTGFNSPAYFSQSFKDLFGQSPSTYRSAAQS